MQLLLAKVMIVSLVTLAIASLTACGGDDAIRFIQVNAGGDHTCGLRSDGSVVCWGSDEYGQLSVPADERFTAVAAAGVHTVG